jgi:O-antigen ligase
MRCLIGIATLLSLYGLYQRAFGFDALLTFLSESPLADVEVFVRKIQSGRVFSTFVLPSSFAGYLLLTAPLTLFFIKISRGKSGKILCLFCFLIQASAFLLTFSLGALFSFLISLIIISSLAITKRKAAMLVSVILLFLILGTLFMFYRDIDPFHPFAGQNPLTLRGGNMKTALLMFRDHPFFGVGNGSFGIAFSQYRDAWMNESNYAHNSYLQVVAENGFIAVPLLLAFGFFFFRRLFLRIRGSAFLSEGTMDRRNRLFPFLAFSCLSFVIHNLIDFTFYHASVSFLFVSLLGVFFSENDSSRKEDTHGIKDNGDRDRERKREEEESPGRVSIRLFQMGLAGTFIFAFVFSLQSYISDLSFQQAQHFTQKRDWKKADRAVRRAVSINPFKSDYRVFRAQLLVERDFPGYDPSKSRVQAEKAVSMDPWIPYYHSVLSDIQIQMGEVLMAYGSISRASELYPIKNEYHQKKRIMEETMDNWVILKKENREKEIHGSSSF